MQLPQMCIQQKFMSKMTQKNPTAHVISGSPPQPWLSHKGSDPLVHRRAPGPNGPTDGWGSVGKT